MVLFSQALKIKKERSALKKQNAQVITTYQGVSSHGISNKNPIWINTK
jgi:hypothetical protein